MPRVDGETISPKGTIVDRSQSPKSAAGKQKVKKSPRHPRPRGVAPASRIDHKD
jgi:hypothetical protein